MDSKVTMILLLGMYLVLMWAHHGVGQPPPMEDHRIDSSINESVGFLYSKDSSFQNPVFLRAGESNNLNYTCRLTSPVCSDTLCQVVLLNLSWDLAGYYVTFDTIPGYPLTKHDHKPFTTADYKKLHTTLGDLNSVLGRTMESELLDSSSARYSEKIDAVTGATALQVREAVVDGALYTTYTLWHVVNGPIRESLIDHTLFIYNPAIEKQMLGSSNPMTVILALKQWSPEDYHKRFNEILQTMERGFPLVNFFIAKNLPPEVLSSPSNQQAILKIWEHLDWNVKSLFSEFMETD